jgi:ABC-2 type transport system permease protein
MTGRAALLRAAVSVELRKVLSSWTARTTLLLLVCGVGLLAGSFSAVAASGDAAAIAKLGPAAAPGWTGLLSGALQVTAAAAVLAFGVLLSWIVGREFTDGTITGLFALPVSRRTQVAGKLIVFLLVTAAAASLLVGVVLAVGLALGFGLPGGPQAEALGRLWVVAVLAGPLALPCAWAATVGRGLLAGVGLAVTLLVAAQVAAIGGLGPWFPVAAPALWALDPSTVGPVALLGVAVLGAASAAVTVVSWSRLQLDR